MPYRGTSLGNMVTKAPPTPHVTRGAPRQRWRGSCSRPSVGGIALRYRDAPLGRRWLGAGAAGAGTKGPAVAGYAVSRGEVGSFAEDGRGIGSTGIPPRLPYSAPGDWVWERGGGAKSCAGAKGLWLDMMRLGGENTACGERPEGGGVCLGCGGGAYLETGGDIGSGPPDAGACAGASSSSTSLVGGRDGTL